MTTPTNKLVGILDFAADYSPILIAAGEMRKALKSEALKLEREARAAIKAAKIQPDAGEEARKREGWADEMRA